jgi:hypothetical protein
MRKENLDWVLLSEYKAILDRAEKTEREIMRLGPDIEKDRKRMLDRTFRETIAQAYLIEKVLLRAYGRKESRQIISDVKWQARK